MHTPNHEPTPDVLRFRESEPVELWSATFSTDVSYDSFTKAVQEVAKEDGQRYTGFITRDAEGDVVSFTRTRYPRAKYGVAAIETCERGMAALANRFDTRARVDPQHSGIRIVLGLIEGYDKANIHHTVEEVQAALPDAAVHRAEIFALRPGNAQNEASVYSEPAAIIRIPANKAQAAYELAFLFKQERFAVENFDTGLAHMVETSYCTEPDIQ